MSLRQDLCKIADKVGEAFRLPAFSAAFYAGGETFTVTRGCDERTRFAAASCTKSFTAGALLKLMEQGASNPDTPVSRILLQLRLKDEKLLETLTVRDLLCHRSGLPACDLSWYACGENFTEEDLFRVLREISPNVPLGTVWQYNNLGYALLGPVTEALTGKSWRESVEELLLNPLGIEAAFCPAEAVARGNTAAPHEWKNGRAQRVDYVTLGAMAPAGALYMSARELLKWDVCLLHGGRRENTQLLSPESVRTMLTPQIAVGEPIAPFLAEEVTDMGYGLGFQTELFRGERLLFHTGSIDGFHAVQLMLPERDFTAVLLCNLGGTRVREAFRYAVCGRVLNSPVDYIAAFSQEDAPAENKETSALIPPAIPQGFAGNYHNPLYGELTLEQTEEGFSARLGRFVMPVLQRQDALLLEAPEIGEVTLEILPDGTIRLKLEPAAEAAVFERKAQ